MVSAYMLQSGSAQAAYLGIGNLREVVQPYAFYQVSSPIRGEMMIDNTDYQQQVNDFVNAALMTQEADGDSVSKGYTAANSPSGIQPTDFSSWAIRRYVWQLENLRLFNYASDLSMFVL